MKCLLSLSLNSLKLSFHLCLLIYIKWMFPVWCQNEVVSRGDLWFLNEMLSEWTRGFIQWSGVYQGQHSHRDTFCLCSSIYIYLSIYLQMGILKYQIWLLVLVAVMADQLALRVLWQMYVVSMNWASLKLVQHIERICLFGFERRCSPLWPNHMASLNKIESQIHTGGRRGGRWMGRVRKRAMLTHQFYQWLSSKLLQYIRPRHDTSPSLCCFL